MDVTDHKYLYMITKHHCIHSVAALKVSVEPLGQRCFEDSTMSVKDSDMTLIPPEMLGKTQGMIHIYYI